MASEHRRLADLMLAVAGRLQDDPTYGTTKLNKALFLCDHLHYKRLGSAISGAVYERLPRAPGPRDVLAVWRELVRAGEAAWENRGFLGHVQDRLVPLHDPGSFSDSETTMIDQVCGALRGHAHLNLVGWQLAAEREEIPYESAFLSSSTPTRAELDRAAALAADLGLVGGGPGGQRGPGGQAPARRDLSWEWRGRDELAGRYPRGGEVIAGIAWACTRWPDGFHRIPGTRLHLLKTEWPTPALGTWFTLEPGGCTIWAMEEISPNVPEEDGSE